MEGPWRKPSVEEEQPRPIYPEGVSSKVQFKGQMYTLLIAVPAPPEDKFLLDRAKEQLSSCVQDIWNLGTSTQKTFHAQSLYTAPPTQPKVCLVSGAFSLYAIASSNDAVTAARLALDRLCLAITQCRARDTRIAGILQQYWIQVLLENT